MSEETWYTYSFFFLINKKVIIEDPNLNFSFIVMIEVNNKLN